MSVRAQIQSIAQREATMMLLLPHRALLKAWSILPASASLWSQATANLSPFDFQTDLAVSRGECGHVGQ
jgi:hypothetical protein